MSWNRTSLSLIAFGFTLYQYVDEFQRAPGPILARPGAAHALGIALIVAGTIGTLVGAGWYWHSTRYLRSAPFDPNGMRAGLPTRSLTLAVAIISALIGMVTTVWIATRG